METYQTKHFKAYARTPDSYWLEFYNGVKSVDLIRFEDGFWYYLSEQDGATSSYCLREIADILDQMNKPYEDEMNAYFDREESKGATQHGETDEEPTAPF